MPRFCFTRTYDPINKVREWEKNQLVIQKLAGSGFDIFSTLELPTNIKHCMPLLDFLTENYNAERRIFIFNGIPIVISLKDVLYITGLRIDGKELCDQTETCNPQTLCTKYLGRYHGNDKKPTTISLNWLKNNFMRVPQDLDESSEEFKYYVRAYVLYLIGVAVVPTKNVARVSAHYLVYLRDIDKIKRFAWGATHLAHLHKSLEAAQIPNKDGNFPESVAGSLFVLQCFIAEYIPSIASMLTSGGTLPMQLPLMAHWANAFNRVCSSVSVNIADKQRRDLSEILRSLKDEDGNVMEDKIKWNPYERFEDDLINPYYISQEGLALSRTVLIGGQGGVRHSPHEQPKQFGMESIDNLSELIEESSGMTNVQQWHNRWKSLISDAVEVQNDRMSDDDLSNDSTLSPLSTASSVSASD